MRRENDLGRDPIGPLVLRLAVPSMIAQFVNVLYSIIDRMYIGNIKDVGDLALAGVGVCGPIVTLLSSFGTLVGLGGSILISSPIIHSRTL
jgi:Na+-driven multidrug efflux pump